MCFHRAPSDESQVHDSHLFSCAERSAAPLFYEYNAPLSWTSESFPEFPGKICTAQGAHECQRYYQEHFQSTSTSLDVQGYIV